ncbi:hypothetical protein Gpo141_00001616 [Globisporangium polare]
MTSYVMPVRQLSHSLLKRVRSASPSPSLSASSAAADKENSNCCANNAAVMKVTKRVVHSSPRSAAAAAAIMTSSQRPSLSPFTSTASKRTRVQPASWPAVKSCDGVRNAITFLQTSRQHAMMLMLQNHWERAVGVLEKIEKATESVCTQRRKVVIEQANAHLGGGLAAQIDDLGLSDDEATTTSVKLARRSVRFCEQVRVAVADDIDRSSDDVPVPVREEMLVLRASRSIPKENYSEFW